MCQFFKTTQNDIDFANLYSKDIPLWRPFVERLRIVDKLYNDTRTKELMMRLAEWEIWGKHKWDWEEESLDQESGKETEVPEVVIEAITEINAVITKWEDYTDAINTWYTIFSDPEYVTYQPQFLEITKFRPQSQEWKKDIIDPKSIIEYIKNYTGEKQYENFLTLSIECKTADHLQETKIEELCHSFIALSVERQKEIIRLVHCHKIGIIKKWRYVGAVIENMIWKKQYARVEQAVKQKKSIHTFYSTDISQFNKKNNSTHEILWEWNNRFFLEIYLRIYIEINLD